MIFVRKNIKGQKTNFVGTHLLSLHYCWTRALWAAKFPPKITKPKLIGLKLGVKVHCGTQCISVRNRPIVNLNTLGGPGVGPACLNEPRQCISKNWWFFILHFVKNNKSGINRGWNESFWSTQEMYSPCRIFYFFPKFPQIREIIKSLYLATM